MLAGEDPDSANAMRQLKTFRMLQVQSCILRPDPAFRRNRFNNRSMIAATPARVAAPFPRRRARKECRRSDSTQTHYPPNSKYARRRDSSAPYPERRQRAEEIRKAVQNCRHMFTGGRIVRSEAAESTAADLAVFRHRSAFLREQRTTGELAGLQAP